ncbi:hypothetical protein A0H81_06920 [Grifola frondosa]|uniref:Uncharacterized protein n=1 Tax=Grifola frondosa TaxID=5627 RepID=A0A1C7MAM4_GRIFR|nr:hypothetical protein A0H81_06920 [Grifola frondosa]
MRTHTPKVHNVVAACDEDDYCLKAMVMNGLLLLSIVLSFYSIALAIELRVIGATILGPDPQTVNRLNGESFQQDALVSFNVRGVLHCGCVQCLRKTPIHVSEIFDGSARRMGKRSHSLTTTKRMMMGTTCFSRGDGTLHIGFDQHDNNLNYRVSQEGVATNPAKVTWSPDLFGPVLDYLPGLESLDKSVYFINVTYPRFLSIPSSVHSTSGSDLLFEFRVGRSGLGDDWLYTYTPRNGWTQIGRYLEGVNNNAYINGLDFDVNGNLHTTWTYRDYVNDTGQDVAVEAGPNGPENNHDMDFAFSPDLGTTWLNNWNQKIANCADEQPIVPVSAGSQFLGYLSTGEF